MKREGELKSAFRAVLRARLPDFYIFQIATAGWPDRGIVGEHSTSYWEMKHATPYFDSPGNQQLFCMRLAAHVHCRYIIWWEDARGAGQKTMIVHPRHVHDKSLIAEHTTVGFDHEWLVRHVWMAHNADRC